jgi:hypothetical protein
MARPESVLVLKRLPMQIQIAAKRVKLAQEADQVLQAEAQAVQ